MEMVIQQLTEELISEFNNFILEVDYDKRNLNTEIKFEKESIFLSFNYTKTLQKYYGIDDDKIFYIHNQAKADGNDLIENKEESDAGGSQRIAAANAAAFTFEMINTIQLHKSLETETKSIDFKKKLIDELVKFYPQGPEQDNVWARAGGDVSILVNLSNRRAQWYGAIEKLTLGGGGKYITLTSLINEVKDDYPNLIDDISS